MVNTWIKLWLYTTDHKDAGILYFGTSYYFGFLAALLALFMRTQLAVRNNKFLGAAEYNHAVTMHGLLMVFSFLSPLAVAFANYFIPPQIGAKDLAFPRLNALSYWLYAFGGLVTFIGFFSPVARQMLAGQTIPLLHPSSSVQTLEKRLPLPD